MSVDQTDTIDFATIDKDSGDLWLTISDHLPWGEEEGRHLIILQNKINSYLEFIESGEILERIPDSRGRKIVINLISKYPLSQRAETFLGKAQAAVEGVGFRLQHSVKLS
ncbi:DUF6572 domain-containing protein [Amaricoccus sp.]|uniref:DUF6572 domain-containing protein n=1 Tax=Amaricoccus sp. TaxID=1872485 RepID=UPI001B3F2311|nr:DUF6572 domain-containing protein [Amaricoccus sp.]MBP7002076.1 hypothetical protein [Amaricoccus sp.]